MSIARFFLDALDAFRAVGEPRPEDFRAWLRRSGHEPTPEDMRACTEYIRGFRLGQLAGSASCLGVGLHGLFAWLSDAPVPDHAYAARLAGALVFSIAAPHAFGVAWSWMVRTDDNDDAGPGAPTARGT